MKWFRSRRELYRRLEAAEMERDWLRAENARLITGMFEVSPWETQQPGS